VLAVRFKKRLFVLIPLVIIVIPLFVNYSIGCGSGAASLTMYICVYCSSNDHYNQINRI
jgi:TRAP-type uncharacterized transport system fused permease subunit